MPFADSDAEAEQRYLRYADVDPFPSIPPALLNSAEIADYVSATGMIFPFDQTHEKLKLASYEVDLGGPYVYWDETGARISDEIGPGEPFELKSMSIAFVSLAPMFRVPNYLALRFNLRISHVYRGLLLGTGPLVDPGFHGRLSLPLHNLTANDYTIRGGEGLIWLEVTKLNPESPQRRDSQRREGTFFHLPPDKKDLTLDDYLDKANQLRPIQSSVPGAIGSAQREAKAAHTAANQVRNFGFLAILGVAIAIYFGLHGLLDSVSFRVDSANGRIDSVISQIKATAVPQVSDLNSRLCRLELDLHKADPNCPSPSPATTTTP
jgi:deoxycytidine triphosphate deaminase